MKHESVHTKAKAEVWAFFFFNLHGPPAPLEYGESMPGFGFKNKFQKKFTFIKMPIKYPFLPQKHGYFASKFPCQFKKVLIFFLVYVIIL